jgi:hypothetical protein
VLLNVPEFESFIREIIVDTVNDMLFETIVPKRPVRKNTQRMVKRPIKKVR